MEKASGQRSKIMLPRNGVMVMWLWKTEGGGPLDVRLVGSDQVAGTSGPENIAVHVVTEK